jgi:TatD DNase family protein
MQLTDTHCHIHEAAAELGGDESMHAIWRKTDDPSPDAMIARAKENDVTRLICVGTTVRDSQLAVDFVQSRGSCWASVGLHPHEAKDGPAALQAIARLATSPKVVAVGECGLDYFYEHSPKEDQLKALRFQIELALEHDLPLIFHVRGALDDFWPVFDSYKSVRGVLHSFTDSRANMEKALERDLFIGANGIMTFTKDLAQIDMIKAVPLQKLLIETDAPFLTPVPFRGNVNEPAHTRVVAEFLAKVRGEPLEELATQTTRNALTVFNLNKQP